MALGGTVAVLVTRYVEVPAIGPIPDMYDPQWTAEKVWVIAAMLATATAGVMREGIRPRR